jgi:hypothetical protein
VIFYLLTIHIRLRPLPFDRRPLCKAVDLWTNSSFEPTTTATAGKSKFVGGLPSLLPSLREGENPFATDPAKSGYQTF